MPTKERWSVGTIAACIGNWFYHHPMIVDAPKNRELIIDWVNETADGVFSPAILEVAAHVLRYKLLVYQPQAPPVVIPQVPVEPPEVLGANQLSIKSNEWELRQPTVSPAMIRDYLKRLRAHNKTV
jgi:hypothetical protein